MPEPETLIAPRYEQTPPRFIVPLFMFNVPDPAWIPPAILIGLEPVDMVRGPDK